MLERLRRPRWQHPDPDVRRRAVEALVPDQTTILEEVARADADPGVRRLAVRRIRDLDLLEALAVDDRDGGVREQAARRYRQLLGGVADDAPPLETRLARLRGVEAIEVLEHLAREAADAELRTRALERVERTAVLRDVALGDPLPAIRLAALERIDDEAILERVLAQSRTSDKRVSRRAREKLDVLREARERPRRIEAARTEVCAAVERLGEDGHWERDHDRLRQLERDWQALEDEADPLPAQTAQRYAVARRRFEEGLERQRRERATAVSAREAVIARLEAQVRELHASGAAGKNLEPGLEVALGDARAAWERVPPLPAGEEQPLAERFDRACEGVRRETRELAHQAALLELCEAHESLLTRRGAIDERQAKQLGRRRKALGADAPTSPPSRLERRLARAQDKLRARLHEQVERKQALLEGLPARLEALHAAVRDGERTARQLHEEIGADLRELLAMGASRERLAPLQKRWDGLGPQVRVMRAWSQFGADQARERLCEEMESALRGDEDPAALAQRVREARTQWKALEPGNPAHSQRLWRRFDKAATEAYVPCKAYFEDRARERKGNLAARRELVQGLERFLAASDWSTPDWKAVVGFRRDLLAAWQRASPVERRHAKAIEQRLSAGLSALDEHLDRERQRCLDERERLIEEVSALCEVADPKRAAQRCKDLQRQWLVTVPAARSKEKRLWSRFRGGCDAVFARRQEAFDKQRQTSQANLELRRSLCARVEALAEVDLEGLEGAQRDLHRAQGEWNQLGATSKRDAAGVDQHFAHAVARFAQHRQALIAAADRENLQRLQRKARLCVEAETLAQRDGPTLRW
jgi:hypothetical protein